MIREVMIKATECTCEDFLKNGKPCGYRWVSIAAKLPTHCPNRECRSREWNGVKKRGGNRIKLPKPTKIKQGEDEDYEF